MRFLIHIDGEDTWGTSQFISWDDVLVCMGQHAYTTGNSIRVHDAYGWAAFIYSDGSYRWTLKIGPKH